MQFAEPIERYRPGQEVEVSYGSGWYRATVRCINANGTLDASWNDGTFAAGLRPEEVRPMRKDVSPSPPRDDRPDSLAQLGPLDAGLDFGLSAARPHLSPAPPYGSVRLAFGPPTGSLVMDSDALFAEISIRAGSQPASFVTEPEVLHVFRHQPDVARDVFRNPLHPLVPVCSADNRITSHRFMTWLHSVEPGTVQWIADYLRTLDPIAPFATPMSSYAQHPDTLAMQAAHRLSQEAHERELQPVGEVLMSGAYGGVEPRVNVSGSPHRTRQEAAEAAVRQDMMEVVPAAAAAGHDHSIDEPCSAFCKHRPDSPQRERASRASSGQFAGRYHEGDAAYLNQTDPGRSMGASGPWQQHGSARHNRSHTPPSNARGRRSGTRSISRSGSKPLHPLLRSSSQPAGRQNGGGAAAAARQYPVAVMVSNVQRQGLKTNLNGRYRRVHKWPSDEKAGVTQRYKKEAGGAVLYRTQDGRWRLNDGDSAIGWVFSHSDLLGRWFEDPDAGDYTGTAGMPYPEVTRLDDTPGQWRPTSPGPSRKAYNSTFGKALPGKGLMSSGTARMGHQPKPTGDTLYDSVASLGKLDKLKKGQPGFSSSFGSTPRFTKWQGRV